MRAEYDVIVVGAGINGLACAAYLAKAGLEVLVVERRNECGPFALTEDVFGAGAVTDTHAAVCFLPMSPVLPDLELHRFGFSLLLGRAPAAITWPDGRNLVFYYDGAAMRGAMARHSEADATTAAAVRSKLEPQLLELLERILFAEPSAEGLERMLALGSLVGLSPGELRRTTGVQLIEQLYRSDPVRLTLLGVADIGLFGDVTEPGEGALAVLLGGLLAVGTPRGGMHHLVHALVRCYRHHGGTLCLNAPVARVELEGGVARRVILAEESPYGARELRARHAVVLHVTPPVALELLGNDPLRAEAPDLHRKMAAWKMDDHCAFISHFLVRGLPHWGSEPFDPEVNRVPFILRAWDSWDHATRSLQLHREGRTPDVLADVGELYNQAALDRSRLSPDGLCTVSVEIEYPPLPQPDGTFQDWDDRAIVDPIHERHLELMEGLAPGFRKQLAASTYFTPLDNWRRNASALYGHELGGNASAEQWYAGRMPVRALPGLYFSNGIWPVALTHLGSGYVAACRVAEDLGVRGQPWWCHRPMDMMVRRMGVGEG
ncbi:MAG: phytoene desaturase family protein [Myxococcota bacterium]